MNVLIIGSGGREHALAWKIKQSPKIDSVFVAPSNAGTEEIAINVPLSEMDDILGWLKEHPMDLVLVAPESYLAQGMVDRLNVLGIPAFGSTIAASEIEWSKAFSKKFMREEGIPTAHYESFTEVDAAIGYARSQSFPLVIKADGLALGKGVVIAEKFEEAEKALHDMMGSKIFGEAGNEVIIEEYLQGREISIHAFCDGETARLFPTSQDHKRIGDGDMGPNTGGMGTVAPLPWVTDQQMKEIENQVVKPTLAVLKKRGREFKGILFPGIMITDSGPKVIEFNARFGDPEAESYMRLLETDLVDILLACVDGTLADQQVSWAEGIYACSIVCASGGYPGSYEKGKLIKGLDLVESKHADVVVFHAGTKRNEHNGDANDVAIVTNGGRVLNVTAQGDSLQDALAKSYAAIGDISFEGMQYRKDIGKKSLI